jgi:phosphoribosylamine---glycine ligase
VAGPAPNPELTVLVLGSGGREHALVRALSEDPSVRAVHAAPGNPGTAGCATNHAVDPLDGGAVAALAESLAANLVVIGPEAPLVAGVADAVRGVGLACFGPSAAAARIEGSKAFAKEVMAAAGVPTAGARLCEAAEAAEAALQEFGPPYVVKDDGLASGKGVVVTEDREQALAHARRCGRVVIEEYLDGPEVSLFAVTDGTTVLPLQPAQDFKRAHDHDQGPNTGGMGAYSPLPWAPADLVEQVHRDVLQPTVDELARRGTPFAGLLYAGLALTAQGPRVVEFNARFGDPETQALLPRLRTPLGTLLRDAAVGKLADHPPLQWEDDQAAVAVVLAAPGYPDAPRLGGRISGLDETPPDGQAQGAAMIIHAGTARDADGQLISSGGRVLAVVGRGAGLAEARKQAYDILAPIDLDGSFYRTDIAAAAAS